MYLVHVLREFQTDFTKKYDKQIVLCQRLRHFMIVTAGGTRNLTSRFVLALY